MELMIEDGVLYRNNSYFSRCEARNGREDLQPGRYKVTVMHSHAHDAELPLANGLGWIGGTDRCDIVLGLVRGRDHLIPRSHTVGLLVRALKIAAGAGKTVMLEVK